MKVSEKMCLKKSKINIRQFANECHKRHIKVVTIWASVSLGIQAIAKHNSDGWPHYTTTSCYDCGKCV